MQHILVNLPVFYIEDSERWLELFISRGIRPEIGLDAGVLDRLPGSRHREIAHAFHKAGLLPSVHLPFQDLLPGSRDPWVRDAVLARMKKALDTAAIYRPAHMVAHAMYWKPFYLSSFDAWLDNSTAFWKAVSAHWPDHPPIYLENVFETEPEPLARLMDAMGDPGFGVCLDLGHWHSFGGGHANADLGHWIKTLAPWLRHLHLHDNTGQSDHHLGMGKGAIPWAKLFALLRDHGLKPTFTLEPHTEEAFEDTLAFMREHPQWFEALAR